MTPEQTRERLVVLTMSAVQFVNILDFMVVMPLGPDFARALNVSAAHLGYVGGSYTASAAISGIVCAFFLDRFDRRKALLVCMLGLSLGTLLGGFAFSFESLLAARIVAGAFGGPATSLCFSIIADVIPAERRGRATGAVMGAFAAASVLGVPASLELARIGGWQFPFFAISGLGLLIVIVAARVLPAMRKHLEVARTPVMKGFAELARPAVLISYVMTFLAMASGFILIPNISAYTQYNLHYPRERLGLLYGVGGVVSFFTTRFSGRLVDRVGSTATVMIGCVCLSATIYAGFAVLPPLLPAAAMFMLFMFSMGMRNVAYNTLTSKVPRPQERAQFLSMQSAVQHLASALGAFASSRILSETSEHALIGMPVVAFTSIALSLALPPVVYFVERGVKQRAAVKVG
jgi:predicted MFS family arabinose efflux permease